MPSTGTVTEKAFAQKMEAEGYQVFKNGFPDFLCVKNGEAILVEVKAHNKERLKKHQLKMLELLVNRTLEAFVWSPDNPNLMPFQKFQSKATEKKIKAPKVVKVKQTKLVIKPPSIPSGAIKTKDGLVRLIKEYQRKMEWNETELCCFLGIRLDSWSRIKSGKRRPSETFRRAVWNKLPQLRDYIFV